MSGALRYLGALEPTGTPPRLSFNYLGQFDARAEDEDNSLVGAGLPAIGADHDPADPGEHLVDVVGEVADHFLAHDIGHTARSRGLLPSWSHGWDPPIDLPTTRPARRTPLGGSGPAVDPDVRSRATRPQWMVGPGRQTRLYWKYQPPWAW